MAYTSDLVVYHADKGNDDSLYNYLPDRLIEPFKEYSLKKIYPNNIEELDKNFNTNIDICLRRSFWKEYDRAKGLGKKMNIHCIYEGICHPLVFECKFKDDNFLTWLMNGFISDEKFVDSLYDKALRKIDTIVSNDFIDDFGKMDTKKAQLFLQAYKIIENRAKGSVINRSENKTLQVKVDATENFDRHSMIEELKKKMLLPNSGE